MKYVRFSIPYFITVLDYTNQTFILFTYGEMILWIIIAVPLILLVFIILFWIIDVMLFDRAIGNLLSAWAEHWAEKHMPKKD